VHKNLPEILPKARLKFEEHKGLLAAFGTGQLSYLEFHVELRTRSGKYDLPDDAGMDSSNGDDEDEI